MSIDQTTLHQKYPKGLFSIFWMQVTTMVGFAYIFAMATLYCTKELGFTDQHAYTLFAAYGAIVYGVPLFGGFLGDRFLGHKFSVLFGVIISGIGLLLMAIHNLYAFYIGLACFAISTCLQVPNIYCLVGQLYDKHDERRHSGFTLAYVGMNIGSLAASASSGYLINLIGFRMTFVVGAIVMFMTLIAYYQGQSHFSEGFIRKDDMDANPTVFTLTDRIKGLALFFIAIPICVVAFNYPELCNKLILIFGIGITLFIAIYAFRFTNLQRSKLIVFLLLTVVSIGWGTLYMIAPTVLTIFIERNVDRHFWGFLIPTSSVYSLNPFFIVTIGPLLSYLWIMLTRRGHNPSGAFKLTLGVVIMGLGYLVLVPAIASANTLGFSAFYWIILSYLLQTIGELLVNPVGYALVGSLSPPRWEGFLMGYFQLGSGVASVLMGYMASMTSKLEGITNPIQTNGMYSHAFAQYSYYSLALGIGAMLFVPYFARVIRAKIAGQAASTFVGH